MPMDTSVGKVREILRKSSFHHFLVVEEGKLVGVISDRDVWQAVSPFVGTLSEERRDTVTLSRRAHQIMTRHPVTVTKDASVADAAAFLLASKVSCLPVVTAEGRVEGIITWRDIVAAFVKEHEEREPGPLATGSS